jgi:hypothetical protein
LQNEYKLTLYSVFEEILLDPMSSRLTMKSFKKHLLALNGQLPSGLLSDLYREIDTQTKGSIYFNELLNYYLAHSSDPEMMYSSPHAAYVSSASTSTRTTSTLRSSGSCSALILMLRCLRASSWK